MDYEEIKQKLEAFEKCFGLTIEEVIRIADLTNHGYEERIEKMDKIQKGLDRVIKPRVMREIMVEHNKNLGESYLHALLKRRFDAVIEDIKILMEKRNINQMLSDFRKDFDLIFSEVAVISKPNDIDGHEERVRKMDEMRIEMEEITDDKSELRDLLFAHNNNLKMSYFEAMVGDRFNEVLEDIAKFKEGDVKHCLFCFFNIKLLYEILNFRF